MQISQRHHGVHKAQFIQALRRDGLGCEQQFHHHPLRQHFGQGRCPRHAAPNLGFGNAKDGVIGRYAQIAHLRQQPAARIGQAIHSGNHGLSHMDVVAQNRQKIARRHFDLRGGGFFQIHARAKGFVARGGQNQHAQIGIRLKRGKASTQTRQHAVI